MRWKIIIANLATAVFICALSQTAQGWDFIYTYESVLEANADTYIVGQQNVRKYMEWQTPAVTYWGPSDNDIPAILTSKFTFSAPTADISLKFRLDSCNAGYRGDYGYSSAWGSTDGVTWHLLADCPTPVNTSYGLLGNRVDYNQHVPGIFLGAAEFWLQIRMQQHNALTTAYDPRATWADAQFGRWDYTGNGGFAVYATVVPEPTTSCLLLAGGLIFALGRRPAPRGAGSSTTCGKD